MILALKLVSFQLKSANKANLLKNNLWMSLKKSPWIVHGFKLKGDK